MELYNALKTFPFRGMVSFIRKSSNITRKEFNASEKSKDYWLDTRNCKRGKKMNKQCVFETFGTLSNENAADVRAGMLAVMCLDVNYYRRVGHVILGFKNMNLGQWMQSMSLPNVAADELAIFVLSKMYGKHTVIYNKARLWTTLDPPYQMSEEELHENCQIHLVYVGKDSYGILQQKPFAETSAPISVKTMMEPMIIKKRPKGRCQSEPWDLSTHRHDQSANALVDKSPAHNDTAHSDQVADADHSVPVPEPGENIEIGFLEETAVSVNKKTSADDSCFVPLEVKLYRLTNSELEKYLGKIKSSNTKGDNTEQFLQSDETNPEVSTPYSKTGRPLRMAATKTSYRDNVESDNDSDGVEYVTKADNRTLRPKLGKPGTSGPSAA